jgi:hypothetical protein
MTAFKEGQIPHAGYNNSVWNIEVGNGAFKVQGFGVLCKAIVVGVLRRAVGGRIVNGL